MANRLNSLKKYYTSMILRWILLRILAPIMRMVGFGNRKRQSVLYAGQCYYNHWYLSRELRLLGWKADVLNWDMNISSQIYYHGEDFVIDYKSEQDITNYFRFYFYAIRNYDIFHFANKGGLQFGEPFRSFFITIFKEEGFEVRFLKALGKKIVYTNNGCLDGVSQSSFSKWRPESVCSICRWEKVPTVCSDEKNLAWGKFRNEVSDYICLLGGNRADYNDDPRVHEVPEVYCLDPEVWNPQIDVPDNYKFPVLNESQIRLYHAVGDLKDRTRDDGKNIKSSHVYLPLINKLINEGLEIELVNPTGIPNKEVRYVQAQSDIFLDMLTYGWFGANAREAMMLGKPVICFLRSEWLESLRKEIPEYVEELPVVTATPETVEVVLRDLIANKKKRLEIGKRSREFAIKWHSSKAGARRFDTIYSDLLGLKK